MIGLLLCVLQRNFGCLRPTPRANLWCFTGKRSQTMRAQRACVEPVLLTHLCYTYLHQIQFSNTTRFWIAFYVCGVVLNLLISV